MKGSQHVPLAHAAAGVRHLPVVNRSAAEPRASTGDQGSGSFAVQIHGIFVRDVPATVRFYEAAFGLKLRYLHPSSGYAELETGDTLLAFVGEDFLKDAALLGALGTRPNRPSADPIAAQIAFVTRNLNADWARALAAGATVVKEPEAKPWGQTVGYMRDINGILVELCTPSPRD